MTDALVSGGSCGIGCRAGLVGDITDRPQAFQFDEPLDFLQRRQHFLEVLCPDYRLRVDEPPPAPCVDVLYQGRMRHRGNLRVAFMRWSRGTNGTAKLMLRRASLFAASLGTWNEFIRLHPVKGGSAVQ